MTTLIDCEVHAQVTYRGLREHLDAQWLEYVQGTGYGGPGGAARLYPPNAPLSVRDDWRAAGAPAAGIDELRRDVLDGGDVELAIVVGSPVFDLDQIWHPDVAEAFARAANDHLIAEWLDRDDRLRGSLVVPGRDVAAMVDEVERVGAHPRIVQVVLPLRSEQLYGRRGFVPLLEAAVRHDLVVALHPGGFPPHAPTPTGFPSFYVEELSGLPSLVCSQLMSLVAGGAFQRVPELRVVVLESGFTWLAPFLWRFDQEWRGLRREVPWLRRSPSSIIKEHVRFAVQPVDAPGERSLRRAYDWLESDDLLVYGSDYPHAHGDGAQALLRAVGPVAAERIRSGNARALYRLPVAA